MSACISFMFVGLDSFILFDFFLHMQSATISSMCRYCIFKRVTRRCEKNVENSFSEQFNKILRIRFHIQWGLSLSHLPSMMLIVISIPTECMHITLIAKNTAFEIIDAVYISNCFLSFFLHKAYYVSLESFYLIYFYILESILFNVNINWNSNPNRTIDIYISPTTTQQIKNEKNGKLLHYAKPFKRNIYWHSALFMYIFSGKS